MQRSLFQVISLATLFLPLAGCIGITMETNYPVELLEELARAKFSKNTEIINYEADTRGMDDYILLKLRIPCIEKDEFLLNAGCLKPLSTTTRYVEYKEFGKYAKWWTPDNIEPFESGKYFKEDEWGGFYSHVLLETQAKDSCLVYMHVFEMS